MRPRFRKGKEKEKKGGGIPPVIGASSKAPEIGTSVLSGAQAASSAPSGALSGLGSLLQTSGLSALLATKAGLVGLLLAGSTVAAGLSLYLGSREGAGDSRRPLGSHTFAAAGADSASAQASPSAGPKAASTSLDYLAQGNAVLPEAPAPSEPDKAADAAASASKEQQAPAAESPGQGQAPSATKAKLVRAPAINAGGAGTALALKPVDSVGGKVGSGFQDIYKTAQTTRMSSSSRPNYSAGRRALLGKPKSALGQAKIANKLSRAAAASPSSNAASATASRAFDGGSAGPAAGGVGTGGVGDGAAGVGAGPSTTEDSKQVEPPAPPINDKKNKTPYQNLIYVGIGALIGGFLLLMLAAQLIKSGNFVGAKLASGAAAAAGGVAAGVGGIIAGKYGQMVQGLPFMAGGGILAVQAVRVMMEADKAAQDAKAEGEKKFDDAKTTSDTKLESKGCADGSCGDSKAAAEGGAAANEIVNQTGGAMGATQGAGQMAGQNQAETDAAEEEKRKAAQDEHWRA
ncbi:MAG: hypothetical protein HY922_03810 [Elusimicrobia bacterium]|nr:hypothetical protein [Elusimicrobiota bacterium]